MIPIKRNVLNILNPNSGLFEGILAVSGESAYQIAVRYGYEGTEEEWVQEAIGGGIVQKANYASKAGSLNVSDRIGGPTTPVYFNSDGKPMACKVELGEAASHGVSTDSKGVENSSDLVTSGALYNALKESIPDIDTTKFAKGEGISLSVVDGILEITYDESPGEEETNESTE